MNAPHAHHHHEGETALAELLDLDGEALSTYWHDAVGWVRRLAGPHCRRLLDLGAGTGTGAFALAQWFDGAEIVAVDASDSMLDRLRTNALDRGLTARIRTVQADLDAGWPDLGVVDLTWASMSLHHLADPARTLAELAACTTPGGLIAVAEFAEPLRVLPDDVGLGRPGLEQRCLDAAGHGAALPHLGTDWSATLTAAGWSVLGKRDFVLDVKARESAAAARYARGWLERLRSGAEAQLDTDDRAALSALLDGDGPHGLASRGDVVLRGTRTVTVAQRPGGEPEAGAEAADIARSAAAGQQPRPS
jgi:SAM-dependent methyltransferase